jgi:hypothetical protein
MLAPDHAFLSGTSSLQFSTSLRGLGPHMACRRRTLETVEKIVTGTIPMIPSDPKRSHSADPIAGFAQLWLRRHGTDALFIALLRRRT